MNATPSILFDSQGGIARITLNRPERMNAFTNVMHGELRAAFARAEADEAVRVIVLAANGRGFCAGQDLADEGVDPTVGEVRLEHTLAENYAPLISAIVGSRKCVVARLHGIAAGAGCSLVLACDMVIANESAAFSLAFSSIALIPDAGATFLLPRAIGSPLALGYALTGEKFSAQRAAALGMIWKCVPDADLDAEMDALTQRLVRLSQEAVAHTKSLVRTTGDRTLSQALGVETTIQSQLGRSADYAEGVRAFKEKRPAQFGKK